MYSIIDADSCKRWVEEVWVTYSAFAYTIGGMILLAVNEDMQEKDIMKRYQIIGVDEPMIGRAITIE